MFIGQAISTTNTGTFNVSQVQQSDGRVMQKDYQWDFIGSGAQVRPWHDGMLWTRSRFNGGSGDDGNGGYFAFPVGLDCQYTAHFECDMQDVLGGAQMKKIIGTTLDAVGNPLGSVTIQGFLTVNDQYIGQTVSDSGGYYELPTPSAGAQHYLVAYKNGTTDVAGTTVNTIVPT